MIREVFLSVESENTIDPVKPPEIEPNFSFLKGDLKISIPKR